MALRTSPNSTQDDDTCSSKKLTSLTIVTEAFDCPRTPDDSATDDVAMRVPRRSADQERQTPQQLASYRHRLACVRRHSPVIAPPSVNVNRVPGRRPAPRASHSSPQPLTGRRAGVYGGARRRSGGAFQQIPMPGSRHGSVRAAGAS